MKKSDRLYLRVLHADRPDRPEDMEEIARLIAKSRIADLAKPPEAHNRGGWALHLIVADRDKIGLAEYLHDNNYRVVI